MSYTVVSSVKNFSGIMFFSPFNPNDDAFTIKSNFLSKTSISSKYTDLASNPIFFENSVNLSPFSFVLLAIMISFAPSF